MSLGCREMHSDTERRSLRLHGSIRGAAPFLRRRDTWTAKCQKCKRNFSVTVWLWPNAAKLQFGWCFHPKLRSSRGGGGKPDPVHLHFTPIEMIYLKSNNIYFIFLLWCASVGQVWNIAFKPRRSRSLTVWHKPATGNQSALSFYWVLKCASWDLIKWSECSQEGHSNSAASSNS